MILVFVNSLCWVVAIANLPYTMHSQRHAAERPRLRPAATALAYPQMKQCCCHHCSR